MRFERHAFVRSVSKGGNWRQRSHRARNAERETDGDTERKRSGEKWGEAGCGENERQHLREKFYLTLNKAGLPNAWRDNRWKGQKHSASPNPSRVLPALFCESALVPARAPLLHSSLIWIKVDSGYQSVRRQVRHSRRQHTRKRSAGQQAGAQSWKGARPRQGVETFPSNSQQGGEKATLDEQLYQYVNTGEMHEKK